MRTFTGLTVAITAILLAAGPVAAQGATPAAGSPTAAASLLSSLGFPEIVITTDGTDFDAPTDVVAGRYRVVVVNTSDTRSADIELSKAPEDMTFDDVMAAFAEADPESETPPDIFFSPGFLHGGASAGPGEEGDVIVDLTAGTWGFNLFSEGGEDEDVVNLPKEVTVSGEMPAVEDPAHDVEVGMIELEFVMPDTVPAGPSVWKVMNGGEFPHFIAIESYPEPVTAEQIEATLPLAFGMPATPAAVSPDASPVALLDGDLFTYHTGSLVLSSGNTNWIEVDLEPGQYVAFCFISGPGDVPPHALMGMFKIFTVE